MKKKYLLLCCLLAFLHGLSAQPVPQYGIEGWAAHTVGGRGGNLVRVTNLNASGTGSLAEAMAMTVPRTIVFEVGGIINLQGKSLSISKPYVTVAGQTAPGKGITIINGGLGISTHDVVLQHLHIRPGAAGHATGWEPDGLTTSGAWNVVVDHCSFSWAVDENLSASGERFKGTTPDEWRQNTSHEVTFSNNIVAEGLSLATHSKGEHSKGSLIHDNATNIAVLNNLYASNKERNPLFKGGARGVVVNNYIYNPGSACISYGLVDSEWTGYEHQTGRMSLVNNVLQYGPSTGNVPLCKIGNGPCQVYLSGNIARYRSGNDAPLFSGDASKIVQQPPVWNNNIHVVPARYLKDKIAQEAGARPWDRDEVDSRIVSGMLADTGRIINFETEVGGFPDSQPVFEAFRLSDWNIRYLLKLDTGIRVHAPAVVRLPADSLFSVEATTSVPAEKLELLLNGASQGFVAMSPYRWQVSAPAGSYDVTVVAHRIGSMPLASVSLPLNVTASPDALAHLPAESEWFRVLPVVSSGTLQLSFQLETASNVEGWIFDASGKALGRWISGTKASGFHRTEWKAGTLSPGYYFLTLQTAKRCFRQKVGLGVMN